METAKSAQRNRRVAVQNPNSRRSHLHWFKASLNSVRYLRAWVAEELTDVGVAPALLQAYEEALDELASNAVTNAELPATTFGAHIYVDQSGINLDFLTDSLSFRNQDEMLACMLPEASDSSGRLCAVTRLLTQARYESRLETKRDYELFHLNHDRRAPQTLRR